MKERFPIIYDFCRLYLNQTGLDIYGTLASALRQMLADAEKLPDKGKTFKRDLAEEFIEVEASFEQLATDAPHGRCLDFQNAYLFQDDIRSLRALALSQMSGKDS